MSKDDGFHTLQNPRRRAVLRHLLEHDDDQFRMRDVAEEVAAWELDTTLRGLASKERQRVYIALYQSHLPKLDDFDIVSYDQNRGTIEPRPRINLLAPYLDDGLHGAESHLTVPDERPRKNSPWAALSTILSR